MAVRSAARAISDFLLEAVHYIYKAHNFFLQINGLARRESVATWLPLSSWQDEQQAAGNAMEGNHSDLLFQPAAKPAEEQHQAYMPAAVNTTAGEYLRQTSAILLFDLLWPVVSKTFISQHWMLSEPEGK